MRAMPLHLKIESKSSYTFVTVMIVFMAGVCLSLFLLSSVDGFVGTDDYYHSQAALQILQQGRLRIDFPWLPLTILNSEQFVDHHLLYHLYLSPFMYWGGIVGVKLAQSLIFGSIAISFWSLLRCLNVRPSLIWTIGIICVSGPFLYRMLMIRTQAAAVLLILITLHALFRERYRWLIALSFAFAWLYNGFILLPAIALLYMISVWITERRFNWLPVFYVLMGIGLGLIVNPYFPQNLYFIADHLGEKVNLDSSVRVGSEWYPYTTAALLEHSPGALLAFAFGIVAGSLRKVARDKFETTLLLIALLTLFMVFRSRRFIEYFPIFALLFCAVAWGRSQTQWRDLLPSFRIVYYLLYGIIAICILILTRQVFDNVYEDLQGSKGQDYMAGASNWLRQNTEPGEIIFQTDWDDFTYLFFHNPHNTYLVGLDPTYLQVADPFLWNQWVAITQGNVERPSVLISDRFGARFVVSDTYHDAFAHDAEADPSMQLVYRDDNSLIWQIIQSE